MTLFNRFLLLFFFLVVPPTVQASIWDDLRDIQAKVDEEDIDGAMELVHAYDERAGQTKVYRGNLAIALRKLVEKKPLPEAYWLLYQWSVKPDRQDLASAAIGGHPEAALQALELVMSGDRFGLRSHSGVAIGEQDADRLLKTVQRAGLDNRGEVAANVEAYKEAREEWRQGVQREIGSSYRLPEGKLLNQLNEAEFDKLAIAHIRNDVIRPLCVDIRDRASLTFVGDTRMFQVGRDGDVCRVRVNLAGEAVIRVFSLKKLGNCSANSCAIEAQLSCGWKGANMTGFCTNFLQDGRPTIAGNILVTEAGGKSDFTITRRGTTK